MGIILTEGQLNKLVKAVLKEDAGPSRYRKHEKDLKEIDLYKFSEPRTEKKYGPEDYRDVITSSTPVKTVGEFSYYYVDSEDNYAPVIKFFVVDKKNEEYVGHAEFEMRYSGDFFVTLPLIRSKYRSRGIATEIYKSILGMGDIVSGKAQSHQAARLWLRLFDQLPNKMYYVDDNGKSFDVYKKDDQLFTTKTDTSVYDVKGGYLRLTRN